MVKKIILFFLFISLFFLININVNGESITILPKKYIQINIGDDDLIEENNLEIVSGVVDWDKVGSYFITYKDRLDNIYKKEFIVFQDYNNQYFLNKEAEHEINLLSNNEILDVFYVSSSSYYLISNYQEEDETYYDQEKICVTFYENNEYKWEYHYYKYSRYSYGYLYNNNLIITGLVYNENNNYINTIVLFEITPNREIIKTREIRSNTSCFCYGLNVYNNNIFLITSTSGNQGDYLQYKKDNDHRLVILKLSYNNFKILDGKTDNTFSNYSVIDSSFYDSRIAINISFKENIKINNVSFSNAIIEYTDLLEYYNCYYYSLYNKDYYGCQITQTDVCVFLIDNSINKNCITIQYLNNDINNKQVSLDLETKYNVNRINVFNIDKNNIYLSMYYHQGNNDYFLGFAKVCSEKGVSYYPVTTTEKRVIKTKICDGIIKNLYYNNDLLYYESYNLIEILSNFNQHKDYDLLEKTVKVNGIDANLINYFNNVDLNLYGEYNNILFLEDQFNNEYVLEEIYNLYLQTNIKQNEQYQIGYNLSFNGEATLNGVAINNNFKVNDIGNYLLIIKGKNNVSKTISFSIDELTMVNEPIESDKFCVNKVETYNKLIEDTSYINNNISIESSNGYETIIPIVIIMFIVSVMMFIIVRKKI